MVIKKELCNNKNNQNITEPFKSPEEDINYEILLEHKHMKKWINNKYTQLEIIYGPIHFTIFTFISLL